MVLGPTRLIINDQRNWRLENTQQTSSKGVITLPTPSTHPSLLPFAVWVTWLICIHKPCLLRATGFICQFLLSKPFELNKHLVAFKRPGMLFIALQLSTFILKQNYRPLKCLTKRGKSKEKKKLYIIGLHFLNSNLPVIGKAGMMSQFAGVPVHSGPLCLWRRLTSRLMTLLFQGKPPICMNPYQGILWYHFFS